MSTKAPFAYDGLDRLFHERGRLAVCTCLVANPGGMTFTALQDACALTDGNLNRHLHALAEAQVVSLGRVRIARRAATLVRITPAGKRRFLDYIDALEAVVRAVNASAREGNGASRAAIRLVPSS
ncbi:MAG: transcriptional regulator [Vulcanimicrobiaceae bacterium]